MLYQFCDADVFFYDAVVRAAVNVACQSSDVHKLAVNFYQ